MQIDLRHCRRLFLRNLELRLNIGVHDFEKQGAQRLLVNVDVYVPLAATTPKADDIAEVVDYDFIRAVIARRASGSHVELQETVCDGIAAELLAHPQVVAVQVSTEKPDVYADCAGVGVEVFLSKKEGHA